MLTAKVAKALFDYKDGELFWKIDINTYVVCGQKAGNRQKVVTFERIKYPISNVIYLLHYGRFPLGKLTHINGDEMDCRIENLRDISHYEYYSQHPAPISAVKVESIAESNTFNVTVNVFGKQVVLDNFKSLEDAVSAFEGIQERLTNKA